MTTTAAAPTAGLTRFEAAQKAIPTTAHQQPGTAHQRALEASIWPTRPRVAGRQSVAGAVRAEWLKLRTLVSTWITSAITIAIMVLFGAGLAVGYAGSPERADVAKDMISSGSTLGMIVVAVLGALVVTGEYASGQIRSSVVAVPHRGRLFAAKALVVAAFSFILGVTSVLLSYAVSYPFMKGHAGALTNTHYLGLFWGTGLSFTVIALMARHHSAPALGRPLAVGGQGPGPAAQHRGRRCRRSLQPVPPLGPGRNRHLPPTLAGDRRLRGLGPCPDGDRRSPLHPPRRLSPPAHASHKTLSPVPHSRPPHHPGAGADDVDTC